MPYLSRLDVVTPPVNQPITLSLARQNARIDQSYYDDLLTLYIDSATNVIERFLDRALITQTLKYSLVRTTEANAWPLTPAPLFILPLVEELALLHAATPDIGLLRNPVQSVGNVTVGSWGQTDTTLVVDTDYNVDLTVNPARIHLLNGSSWDMRSHISITYTAGYGPDYTYIPKPIIHALLLLVAHSFENRGDTG